jgi:hypothetical protein
MECIQSCIICGGISTKQIGLGNICGKESRGKCAQCLHPNCGFIMCNDICFSCNYYNIYPEEKKREEEKEHALKALTIVANHTSSSSLNTLMGIKNAKEETTKEEKIKEETTKEEKIKEREHYNCKRCLKIHTNRGSHYRNNVCDLCEKDDDRGICTSCDKITTLSPVFGMLMCIECEEINKCFV